MKSFLYQGQYYDFETKLAYNRFRYYSPETGAYISQDPIRLNGNNPNLYAYVKDNNCWMDRLGLDCENITPRRADNLEGGPLENATQVSGRFSLEEGPPNGILFRADTQNNITSYAVYDNEGMIIKRVDVTGAAHRGVPTPHVVEYGRNTYTDSSGQIVTRVQSPSSKEAPRPATAEEIP